MNPKNFIKGWNQLNRDLRLITVSLFFWGLGVMLWGALFSIHLSDLGATPIQIGLVFSLSSLLVTFSSIPGGIMADRFDRKYILIFFWLLGSLSAPVLALAQNWLMAIPGALLYYASIMSTPAINAYVSDGVDENKLSMSFAIIYATAPVSMLIGPVIGGRLADIYGIRTLFVISFFIYLISTAILFFISSQKPPRVEHTVRQTFVFLRNKQFLLLCGLAAVVYLYLGIINPFVSLHLSEVYGYDLSTIGLLTSVTAVGGTLMLLLFGRLGDRWDRIGVFAIAVGLFGLSSLLIGAFAILPLLSLGFFLRGSRDISESMTQSIVASIGRKKVAGLYFGAFGLITSLGKAIAPQVGGWLYGLYPNQLFQIIGLVGILLAFIVAFPGRWFFNAIGRQQTAAVIETTADPLVVESSDL